MVGASRLVASRIAQRVNQALSDRRERNRPSSTPLPDRVAALPRLLCELPTPRGFWTRPERLEAVLRHEFDLLGSGPVIVAPPPTIVLPPAQRRPAAALERLLSRDYRRIDWQIDFKSGFRWDGATRSHELPFGDQPGVDVKVPWELARMEHLPGLALGAAAHRGTPLGERCLREIRNQVLDFAATNPPRFGVNWICAMDVGIRAANWVIAESILRAAGLTDQVLQRVLVATLFDHAQHLTTHLEWSPHLRSNHYLADIAGLLFCCAWLPGSPATDAWLRFAARDLLFEIELQFDDDGANFEGSTSYHRLSAEMAVYGVALLVAADRARPGVLASGDEVSERLHAPPLAPGLAFDAVDGETRLAIPAAVRQRLEGMARFTKAIAREHSGVAQIGDNDSGRFLSLDLAAPRGSAPHAPLASDGLDHRHLLRAIEGLDGGPAGPHGEADFEREFVRSLAGGRAVIVAPSVHPAARSPTPALTRFDHFGLFVWTTPRLHLVVRCGNVGQRGNGGHAHCDQLAIDCALDGHAFVVDCGTYVYTPAAHERNAFRGAAMHNALAVEGREPNDWHAGRAGLFHMIDRGHAELIACEPTRFSGRHVGFGAPYERSLSIADSTIELVDRFDRELVGAATLPIHLAPDIAVEVAADGRSASLRRAGMPGGSGMRVTIESGGTLAAAPSRFSAAYGCVEPSRAVVIRPEAGEVRWSLQAL